MRLLYLGDVVGKPGRRAVAATIPRLITESDIQFVVANCENAAGGVGVDAQSANELLAAGVDVLTSGNHVWAKRDIIEYIGDSDLLLRPANYPPGTPGWGL